MLKSNEWATIETKKIKLNKSRELRNENERKL